jgi:hypothetical protein
MKITLKWLEEKEACQEGLDWFKSQYKMDSIKVLEKLIAEDKLNWANWLIVRLMEYKQYVSYAIFATEQVLPIFEKQFPNDDRPRKAIEAAKKCVINPSKENKKAYAAAAAAAAADAAAAAAAADAAKAAAAAAAAAYAAAAAAAYAAAYDATDAAATIVNRKKMLLRILNYGMKLLNAKVSKPERDT